MYSKLIEELAKENLSDGITETTFTFKAPALTIDKIIVLVTILTIYNKLIVGSTGRCLNLNWSEFRQVSDGLSEIDLTLSLPSLLH